MTIEQGQIEQTRAAAPRCRFCGAAPAINATVGAHRAMLLLMQFRHVPGPYCRDCGIAAVRELSSQTLWQGWWNPVSLFATPVVLLTNLVQRLRFAALAKPVRLEGSPRPLPAGRPLFLRGTIFGLLVPVLVVVLVINA